MIWLHCLRVPRQHNTSCKTELNAQKIDQNQTNENMCICFLWVWGSVLHSDAVSIGALIHLNLMSTQFALGLGLKLIWGYSAAICIFYEVAIISRLPKKLCLICRISDVNAVSCLVWVRNCMIWGCSTDVNVFYGVAMISRPLQKIGLSCRI